MTQVDPRHPSIQFNPSTKEFDRRMTECIENCTNCHLICSQLITHCLSLGGNHASVEHIRNLQDCADICAVSAQFMLRNSEHHTSTCSVCAEVCKACAKDCASFSDQDELMKRCEDICRACAESCSQMAMSH